MSVELFALPHHGHVRRTLRALKKRTDKPLQYVAVRDDWVCLYASESPQSVLSEWWLDNLLARELSVESTLLAVAQPHGVFYCIYIEQGVVRQVWEDAQPNWHGVMYQQAQMHYLVEADELEVEGDFSGQRIDAATAQERQTLARYALKPVRRAVPWKAVGVLGVCLLGGGLWLHSHRLVENESSNVSQEARLPVVELPAWARYRLTLNGAVPGHAALTQVRNIATYCALMPAGWSCDAIAQEGQQVDADINRQEGGLLSVWQTWLHTHPEMAAVTTSTIPAAFDVQHVSVVLPKGLPAWQSHLAPMGALSVNTYDALTLLGMRVERGHTASQSGWESITWQVSKGQVTLGELTTLAQIFEALPASISMLTLTPVSSGDWSLSFTMTLYGGL